MTTQQQNPQNPAFYRCMLSCLNENTKNPVSESVMEMRDCYVTEVPQMDC